MRIKESCMLQLIILSIIIHLCSSDLLEDKMWSACTEEQEKSCLPGRCKPAPMDYPESYTCECTHLTYLDRVFNPKKKPFIIARCTPQLYNPCVKCHKIHTLICSPNSNSSSICQCYEEYSESSLCFERINPCELTPDGSSYSGNAACKTEFGNLCVPRMGTTEYTCICITPFRANKELKFPNCMGEEETPCDRQLCVGFLPEKPKNTSITPRRVIIPGMVDSPYEEGAKCTGDGTCVCPKNWHGPHCIDWYALPLAVSWTSWSYCKPDCLDRTILSPFSDATGIGYKVSKSFCDAEDQRYCGGTMQQWSRCKVTDLCSSENEKDTNKFDLEMATVTTKIMREFYIKNISTQLESPELLIWSEKWNLFFIYFLTTVFGFCLTVSIMEMIAAIRLTKEQINEFIEEEGEDMEGRRFKFHCVGFRRKMREIEA